MNRQGVWAVNKMGIPFSFLNNTITIYLYAYEPICPLEAGKIMKLEKDNGINPFYRKECMTHGVLALYWNKGCASIKIK